MNNKIKPSIPAGFMELLPKEQLIFDDIITTITNIYRKNGCLPMDTPIVEKGEILLAKSAGETEKQIYKVLRGDKDLALRFDLTVPIARYVAEHFNELIFPFKRYQLGKVYRGEKNQKGRYREFYQFDVDIVGIQKLDLKNDAFVISLIAEALNAINLNDYSIHISNRKILVGLLEALNVSNTVEVLSIIDKYDKVGRATCMKVLQEALGEDKSQLIVKLIDSVGSPREIMSTLKDFKINNPTFQQGIYELERVIETLNDLAVKESNYKIDLKIIRGLDYYTGTIFETFLNNYENYGSISSGGRYDDLTGLFSTMQLPGVGMSIGITRLFFILKEIGFLDHYKKMSNVDYLIIPIGDTFKYCSKLCKDLHLKGFKAEIYLDEGKLKKKLDYANKQGIEKVILIGEDEIKNGELIVRNMTTGEQIKKNIIV